MIDEQHRQPHWNATKRHALIVLAIMLGFVLLVPLFSEQLDQYRIFGFSLGYFLLSTGSVFLMVFLLFWHTNRQDRIDRKHGASENI